MTRIAVNNRSGEFGLSQAGIQRYRELTGERSDQKTIARDDPALIQVIEELGPAANGPRARLRIADVPDGVNWVINGVSGVEWVEETPRTW